MFFGVFLNLFLRISFHYKVRNVIKKHLVNFCSLAIVLSYNDMHAKQLREADSLFMICWDFIHLLKFDSFCSSVLIERQVVKGIPLYSARSDNSGPEMSNRIAGSKRSNPDSAFMVSSRDGVFNLDHDSHENSHLIKV